MMNHSLHAITLKFSFVLLISIALYSCKQGSNEKQNHTEDVKSPTDSVMQDKDDLLAGVSKAICYSGFRSGQHPDRGDGAVNPSYENILEDLTILSKTANFELIRLYDSGENSEMVLKVIQDNKLDIKVMLGIWLKAEFSNHESCAWLTQPIPQEELNENGKANKSEIEKGIKLANNYPNIVVAVNVGNEALVDWNDHKVHVDTVIAYVRKVKSSINQLVTVADNYDWWAKQGASLANEVDFLSIHVYPIWVGKDIDEGFSLSVENVMEVRRALPESKIVITEAGWASVASEFGERASEEKQLQYYSEIMEWAAQKNITTFFFEAFDEDWKGNPENMMGAEKHWGLYTVDRKPKKVMQHLYSN